MKRSKQVLVPRMRKAPVFGMKALTIAVASIVASSCSFKEEAHIFKTIDECESSNKFTHAECDVAYKKALVAAKNTAPRFSSLQDCEQEFGRQQCQPQVSNSGSSSYFMPLMTGFLISQALQQRSGYYSNPLFSYYGRSYSGYGSSSWVTADGARIAKGNKSKVNVNKSAFKPKPKVTRTISRGGFGSKVSAKSSWGGGSSRSWGG